MPEGLRPPAAPHPPSRGPLAPAGIFSVVDTKPVVKTTRQQAEPWEDSGMTRKEAGHRDQRSWGSNHSPYPFSRDLGQPAEGPGAGASREGD